MKEIIIFMIIVFYLRALSKSKTIEQKMKVISITGIITLLLLLVSLSGFAQDTTVESTNKWKDHWNASLNYSYMNVNDVEQHLLNATYHNDYVKEDFDLLNACNYTLLMKGNSSITNDFSYKIQPRVFVDNISLFDYVQVSSIYSRKVDFRFENLLGFAYYFVKNKSLKASISYGYLTQISRYPGDSVVFIPRHSGRFQINGSNKNVNYFFEIYYQPEIFNHVNNTNYNYTAKVSYKLDNKLSFNISLVKTYEQLVYKSSSSSNVTSNSNTNVLFGLAYTY